MHKTPFDIIKYNFTPHNDSVLLLHYVKDLNDNK